MNIKDIVTDHTTTPVNDLTNLDKRKLNKKNEHLKGRGFDYSAVDPKFWPAHFKNNIYLKTAQEEK